MSKIIDRISEIIEDKRLSNRAFEMSIGASNGMIGRAVSKGTDITAEWLSKIIDAYPDINSEWLLTGNGDRYRTKPLPIASDVRSPYMTGDIRRADNSCDRQRIPVYDMGNVPGLVSLFTDGDDLRTTGIIETDLLPKCDGGLRISGDGMYPLLKNGDMVFYKRIHNVRDNIIWGEMYLVSFDMEGEEYITVKYLQKPEPDDHVRLVSHNGQHDPMDIHISRIRALALVKASLRLNSIK